MGKLPNKFLPRSSNITGQALLLVVLILSVLVVVVLSASSRSVNDVQITTSEEDSARAFSAAEAGIEQALLVGTSGTTTQDLSNDTQFETIVDEPQNLGDYFKYPDNLKSGESATFWFVSHDGDKLSCSGSFQCVRANSAVIYWGTSTADTTPAVQISLYYDNSDPRRAIASTNDYSNVQVYRTAADPNPTRVSQNNFTSASVGPYTVGNTTYPFRTTLSLPSILPSNCGNPVSASSPTCLLFAKVKVLYTTTPQPVALQVTGPASSGLPSQGIEIQSTGSSGDSTRRIVVFRSYPEPPSVFDAAIFSTSDLVK